MTTIGPLEVFSDLVPNWETTIEEGPIGWYKLVAWRKHAKIEIIGTDPEDLIRRAKVAAEAITSPPNVGGDGNGSA
jgi:hypothetical protein